MFVSVEAIRQRAKDNLNKAQAEHDKLVKVLDALPAGTPVPSEVHTFGYCADYSLHFEGVGLVETLLKLYPPLELLNVRGGAQSQKPRKYLRESEERDALLPLHPVLRKGSSSKESVIWWTTLAGVDVQVHVDGAQPDEGCPDLERYHADTHRYTSGHSTFYIRRLAPVDGELAPMARWHSLWEDFAKTMRTPQQRYMLNVVRTEVLEGKGAPTSWGLPEPQYVKGGTAMRVGPGEDLVSAVQEAQRKQAERKEHRWDHHGDYWTTFTPEESDRMLAFAQEQHLFLPAAQKAQAAAEERVKQAFADLLAGYSFITTEHSGMQGRVEQRIRKVTGLHVQLMGLNHTATGDFSVWVRFSAKDRGLDFKVPGTKGGKRLQPQDIEVEYL